MKLPKDHITELACSVKQNRPSLEAPYLDITKGVGNVVSTSGHVISVTPVDLGKEDTAGLIPIAALKEARKLAKREDNLTLDCSDSAKVTLSDGRTFPRADTQFPNWRMVIPAEDSEVAASICINAELLAKLAKSLGTAVVKIETLKGSSGLRVAPHGLKTAVAVGHGVIMPVKVKEGEKSPQEQRHDKLQALEELAQMVAKLNPDAGEIGAGMLANLVEKAREINPIDPLS